MWYLILLILHLNFKFLFRCPYPVLYSLDILQWHIYCCGPFQLRPCHLLYKSGSGAHVFEISDQPSSMLRGPYTKTREATATRVHRHGRHWESATRFEVEIDIVSHGRTKINFCRASLLSSQGRWICRTWKRRTKSHDWKIKDQNHLHVSALSSNAISVTPLHTVLTLHADDYSAKLWLAGWWRMPTYSTKSTIMWLGVDFLYSNADCFVGKKQHAVEWRKSWCTHHLPPFACHSYWE